MEPQIAAAAAPSTPDAGRPHASARPQPRPQSAAPASSRPRTLRIPADDRSGVSARRVFAKPRPPSASTTLRRPRPQSAASNQLTPSAISPLIMREEIETQRRITRRAQRECNALRVQLAAKQQEVALLARHLRAFDVESRVAAPAASAATTTAEQLQQESRRLDAYKKTLLAMLDRLARHLHFQRANAELLESQRAAAAREAALLQDKVAQERSLCAELEFQLAQLRAERRAHAQHAAQVLASLRTELASRARVHRQREEADRRREEMLRLVESRPADASADAVSGPPPPGRRDSFQLLLHESLRFLDVAAAAAGSPDASGPENAAALSSRRLAGGRSHTAAESLAAAMRRETFFQVYESQYERILQETKESDLGIVLERFRGFAETSQRLQQIEKELAAEDLVLERKRVLLSDQLQQLRLSGTAEVEKRKKIRDFLEEQLLLKAAQRAQAQEAYARQLKTFSYVQQGILNITELLKCLEDKFSPPTLVSGTVSVCGSVVHRSVLTPSAKSEIDWLHSLLHACRLALRSSSSSSFPSEFTREQIALLATIDASLGLAAGEWAAERVRRDIVGGNVTRRADGVVVEEEEENDDELGSGDDEDDGSEEDQEVESRDKIKSNESETLAQAELLLRTLDSRQQLKRQELSIQRMRRVFGLSGVDEHDESEQETEKEKDPEVDQAAKLAAVHAFFREKRMREKHEQQEKRETIAALGGMMMTKRPPSATPNHSANGAAAMAAIMAEMRAGPAHRQSASGIRPAGEGERVQRKRSNGVTFALPMAAMIQQAKLSGEALTQKRPSRSSSPFDLRPSSTSPPPQGLQARQQVLVVHQRSDQQQQQQRRR